jgi:hypothetical protein
VRAPCCLIQKTESSALASARKTAKLEFGLSPKEIAMGNRDKQKKEKKKPKKTPVPKLTG